MAEKILLKSLSSEERLKFWEQHVVTWKGSKLSQAEYCRLNNLDKNLLSKWKRKILFKEDKQDLVEIPMNNSLDSFIDIIVNDSLKIKVDANFDPDILVKVLKVIGAYPCS